MTPTALALFTGAFALLFAPPLVAQDVSPGAAALLGQGAASIELPAVEPVQETLATASERALLGRRSGVRLRLEPDDRAGGEADAAARALLGR